MKASLKVKIDKLPDLLGQLQDLSQSDVLVGIPDSDPGRKDGPASNALIGYIQETGSPSQNIPARPFLVPGVSDASEALADRMGRAASDALSGASPQKQLMAAGFTGQNAVRRKINTGPFQQLSPVTLAQRRARGRTGTKPLIDTGQLRNSIAFVIRKRK